MSCHERKVMEKGNLACPAQLENRLRQSALSRVILLVL